MKNIVEVKFIESFFEDLIKYEIDFCIMRNINEVMLGDAHDVDIAIDFSKFTKVIQIIDNICIALNWCKLIIINKDGGCRIVFSNIDNYCKIHFVQLDFFKAFTWNGLVLIDNSVLLEEINKCVYPYYVANVSVEAVQQLLSRLLPHGYVKEKYRENVKYIFEKEPIECCRLLSKIFCDNEAKRIYEAVIQNRWENIEQDISLYRISVLKNNTKVKILIEKVGNIIRLIKRMFVKQGIMIAFLGPDGSGKSTIINEMFASFEKVAFPTEYQKYYHWRPGLIKSPKKDSKANVLSTEPHRDKPYNRIVSLGKFMFFNLDYIFGYWFKIRIELAKGMLVVFDRYYYDYYLDKLRYRLNISNKTVDICKFLIPNPDITFVFIGTPEILYDRKKELSVDEIAEQICSLKKSCCKFAKPVIVDVNRNIEEVLFDVNTAIIKYLKKA